MAKWHESQTKVELEHKSQTKAELEHMCLVEARWQFTQASHTPFLQSPLMELFMESNVYTAAFEQVLQGTFECPPGTDPVATRLLQALKCPLSIPPILKRTLDKITARWRQAHKEMSSSLSGIHFGHYMAGMFNPTIAVFNMRLANLGFTTGYSLK